MIRKITKCWAAACIVVVLGTQSTSCVSSEKKSVEVQSFHMGAAVTQKIYGKNAEKAIEAVKNRLREIENKMTVNAPGSEVDNLNEASGKGSVKLGRDTLYVMEKAKKFAELSGGTFDITIGPLVKAWGVFTKNPRIPSGEEIDRLRKLTDYRELTLDSGASSASLARAGQMVDLGGIAKGYAGDEAIQIYKSYGIKSGYINLGGNVVVLGGKPDGSSWNIGVQNPRAENGKYIGILKVKDRAVVSSGDYERFFERDGTRYHHILDPRTGYPADTGLIGTTIVTDNSGDADALSTAIFVLGLEKGWELVERLEGVEALFITRDKKVYVTPGLQGIFTFEDASKEFEYVEKR